MDRMLSSRFFIVQTDLDGNIIDINIDQISSIDNETAVNYVNKVLNKEKVSGKINGYKFRIKQFENSNMVFFIDTSIQTDNFYMVLFLSGATALVCWLILLIIVVLLSGKVVKPVLAGMEKQKQFITNAGHDMKTPLAIIQSNNETMALIHGENKYNVHIKNQTKRLNDLRSNLLTLAKLDEEIPLPKEQINISELVKEVLPVYKDSAVSKNLTLNDSITPDVILNTNREGLRQVISLLLDNALKYTPSSGNFSSGFGDSSNPGEGFKPDMNFTGNGTSNIVSWIWIGVSGLILGLGLIIAKLFKD